MDILEKLEEAKRDLERVYEADGRDTSGNLDKYHTRFAKARGEIRRLTALAKMKGLIPYTEQELLGMKLDAAFPNSAKGRVVSFEGQTYCRDAKPLEYSRSGATVHVWAWSWRRITQREQTEFEKEQALQARRMDEILDSIYPNAGSRRVVEYEGRKFQKRYKPVILSKTGKTVKEWETWWEEMEG